MGDSNPYAPPTVGETEAPVGRRWHVDGEGVTARFGTVLPQVDLDSGLSDGELKCVPRTLQNLNAFGFLRTLLVLAVFFALKENLSLGPEAYLYLFLALFVLRRLGVLAGMSVPQQIVWSFVDAKRHRRMRLRRWLRMGASLFIFAALVFVPLGLLTVDPLGNFQFLERVFPVAVLATVLLIVGALVWSWFDRPKSRVTAASTRWLRISPIHPEALAFLLARQQARDRSADGPRKRLIRTIHLHRYPLGLLLGSHGARNPLLLVRLGLMKLLRSRHLIREAWHFSEAREIPREELCEPLREAVDAWCAAHPDWVFAKATQDTAPAGDLITEQVWLASLDLQHGLEITRVWIMQKPVVETSVRFFTWLADNKAFTTQNQPLLSLSDPELHQRASGTTEQIFEAHLRGLAGHTPSLPSDLPGFLERIRAYNEQTDRLLTAQGYQSETREVSV